MINGAWMKKKRRELGLSLEDVGRAVGLSKATVYKYESGSISNVTVEKLEAIARLLNTNPAILMDWVEPPEAGTDVPPKTRGKPRLGSIACGKPILAMQNLEGFDAVPEYAKCDFTLLCRGDSMIGARIRDGDVVCIRRQETAENGQIAAVLVEGEYESEATLKRVRYLKNGIALWPENPAYEPLVFIGEEANRVRILGVATYFIGKV
jgi:repressor LexA